MSFSIYHMVCAALMHDIGKLIQRTGAPDLENIKYTSKCRAYEKAKYLTHKHVMWTTKFLYDYQLPIDDWDSIAEIAGSHHNKSVMAHHNYERFLDYLIEADNIASSWDREKSEDADQTVKFRFRRIPLFSVFDTVSLVNIEKGKKDRTHFYLPHPRSSDPEFWVTKSKEIDDKSSKNLSSFHDMQGDYQNVWSEFKAEFEKVHNFYYDIALQNKNVFVNNYFPSYLDAIDSLLEKYLWYIPANTMEDEPICSLYHHVRNTACIASALYAADETYHLNSLKNKEEKPFTLIACDLNGIQDYLYNLNPENSRKAAKLLRARSFQVKAILDMLGQMIIDELKLTRFNILSNTAGKLIILSPSSTEIKEKMTNIRKKVDHVLFKNFLGLLSININWNTQIALADLDKHNFMLTLKKCIESMEQEKLSKFKSCLVENNQWNPDNFIVSNSPIYYNEICPYCHRRKADSSIDDLDEEGNKEKVCSICKKEIELGKKLVTKDVFKIYKTDNPETGALFKLGDYCLTVAKKEGELVPNTYYINLHPDADKPSIYAVKPSAGDVPTDAKGNPLDFRKIAEKSEGLDAIAVIKGDVDDLGRLFKDGLFRIEKDNNSQNKICSITEYSTFSSYLDYFFSVVLPNLIQNKYKDSIYTVYSGGDDFCLVGAWDNVIDFARELRESFHIFVASNPELHFSAAICLMHPKAPIRFVIADTEEQLKNTKQLKNDKNRLYLFETIVKWDDLKELFDFAANLNKWLSKDTGVTKQFLYRLLAYHEMYLETQKEEHALHNHMYDALLHYDIKRNIDQNKHRDKLKEEDLNQLRSISYVGQKSILPKLRIPVCYTLYKLR